MNEREKDFIANFCDHGNLCALCNSQRETINKLEERNEFLETQWNGSTALLDAQDETIENLNARIKEIYGKTNYCVLCEQANKEIERLKDDLRKQDTSLLLANQNLEQEVEKLEGKIDKAIEILKSKDLAPTCIIEEPLRAEIEVKRMDSE